MTPTRDPSRRTPRVALATAACLALAACSGGGDNDAAEAPPAAVTSATVPAPVAEGDVCATVPTLDAITAQLGEPVTGVRRLERGPGTDLCEAAGDGVANVQFTRVTPGSREAVVDIATALGYAPTDLGDPALPGAITYAGAVSVFADGVEYTVQAITMDTVSNPNSPAAAQRSAALLTIWLQNLGVAL